MGNFLQILATTDGISKWDSISLFFGNLALSAFVIGYLQAAVMSLPMEQLEPSEMLLVGIISVISSLLISNRVEVLEVTQEYFLKFKKDPYFHIDNRILSSFKQHLYSGKPIDGVDNTYQLFSQYFANMEKLRNYVISPYKEDPLLLVEVHSTLKESFDLLLMISY